MKRLIIFALPILPLNGAFAADLCKAVALNDVSAIESPSSIIKRGEYQKAVTGYIVNRRTGQASFCSHGGYCYPTHLLSAGKKIEALRLTNCKIGKVGYPDGETIGYEVVVDRSKNSAEDLRMDDLENRFLRMGLCSACAGNAAYAYIKKPSSTCGRLAKQALKGNRVAIEKLKRGVVC